MTITAITDSKGELIGAIRGSASQFRAADQTDQTPIFVGLVPGPDQTFTEIQAPDSLGEFKAGEFLRRVREQMSNA